MKHVTIAIALPLLAACSSTRIRVDHVDTRTPDTRLVVRSDTPADVRITRDGKVIYDDRPSAEVILPDVAAGRYRVAINGPAVRRTEFDLKVLDCRDTVLTVRGRGSDPEGRSSVSADRILVWILTAPFRLIGWLIMEALSADDDDDDRPCGSSKPDSLSDRRKSAKPASGEKQAPPKAGSPVKW